MTENTKEEVTVSDGLQLGRNVEQTDLQADDDDEMAANPQAGEVSHKSMCSQSHWYNITSHNFTIIIIIKSLINNCNIIAACQITV